MMTAATAGAVGILQVLLALYTSRGRAKFKTGLGDGGHEELERRIRMHGNLTENAPMFLILLGLVESSGLHPWLATVLGPVFVVCRVSHAYGLSATFGPGANPFRAIGVLGTLIGMVVLAAALLATALPRLV